MRILVLSSSTGGGHDMRARSIVRWAECLRGEDFPVEVERYQALEGNSGLYGFGVEVYNWIQRFCPRLHHVYFNWLELFQVSVHERLLLGRKRYERVLREVRPDVVVSVHAHTNHAFRVIAQRVLPGVRFVTYCGEMHGGYGFSRHWVDPGADAFIGATGVICDAARARGMAPERVFEGGFLLAPHFYRAAEAADRDVAAVGAYRESLGLEAGRFTLLLSTGANGAQNHLDFLAALDAAKLDVQVVALCGRNAGALADIEGWRPKFSQIEVRAMGYQERMFELMAGCDAMVARPGTGTTSEAILAGCPLLLNTLGGVMPQEWITVKYLRSQGLDAERIGRAADLVRLVRRLVENSEYLAKQRALMCGLRPVQHPEGIFKYLKDLVGSA